jgi:sugar lactone lactonase YvrE
VLRGLIRTLSSTFLLLTSLAPHVTQAAITVDWHVLAPVRTPPILYQPAGIALDPVGHLFVADADPGEVRVLSSSAKPLAVLGQSALTLPSGITRSTNGDLYVANRGSKQVTELSPDGKVVDGWTVNGVVSNETTNTFGPTGRDTVTLIPALAIAAGPYGDVFTLQPAGPTSLTLSRYSSTGTLKGTHMVNVTVKINTSFSDPSSTGLGYTPVPLGIAVAPNGTQFVSFQEQICTISPNSLCRTVQILQKRSPNGEVRSEWEISEWAGGYSAPTGLALDPAGHVLIPAPQDDAIFVYSQSGSHLQTWKPAAPGPGDYSDITGIAATTAGAVFVVGSRDRTVQKLGANGRRLAMWGKRQSDIFTFPQRLAVKGSGSIFVSVEGHVKKLRRDGTTAATWANPNGTDGIALGRGGAVYTTYRDGVREFSAGGKVIRTWGTTGRGAGQFRGPNGIAVDSAGNVYVADTFNHRIQKFTPTGAFLKQWGGLGSAEGRFEAPEDVTVSPAGNIYAADDSGNGRIEEFTPGGSFVAQWRVPLASWDPTSTSNYPTSLAVDSAGDIFTVYYSDVVVEIIPNGKPRFWGGRGLAPGEFLNAAGIALGASGALYVTNIDSTYTRNSCIEKLDSP